MLIFRFATRHLGKKCKHGPRTEEITLWVSVSVSLTFFVFFLIMIGRNTISILCVVECVVDVNKCVPFVVRNIHCLSKKKLALQSVVPST